MKTGKSKFIVAAVAATTVTLFAVKTQAGTQSEFTAATAGNWSAPANWTPNQVPGATPGTTDALIDRNNTVNVNGSFPLTNLDLDNGMITGNAGSSLTVSNAFHWVDGSVGNGASITANSAATIGNGSTPLSNAGSITFNASPTTPVGVALFNSGTITLGANTTLELANGSTTSGRYVSSASSSLLRLSYDQNASANYTHQLTGTINTAGDVAVVNADLFTSSTISARDTRFSGNLADLRGNATFSGPVEFDNTTIYAGDDQTVGTITIGGNASLTNVTQLSNDITAASGNDSLQVTGSATVNDLLVLAYLSDGSVPTIGQRFVILNARGGVVGDRSTLIDPDSYVDGYVPAYNSSDPDGQTGEFSVDITATQIALVYVPEPAILLPAAMGLLTLRRRRLP